MDAFFFILQYFKKYMGISYIYFFIFELNCKDKSKNVKALYCEMVFRPKYKSEKTQDLVLTACIEHIMGSFSDQID